MSDTSEAEIDQLITRHLEGDLDEAGLAQLETWLLADPAHRRTFLAAVQVHQALRGRVGIRQVTQRRRLRRPQARRIGGMLVGVVLAAAVVALAMLWWAPAGSGPAPSASPSAAQSASQSQALSPASAPSVTAVQNQLQLVACSAAWCGEEGAWTPAKAGPLVSSEHLRTDPGGSATLAFPDGSTLQLGQSTLLGITRSNEPAGRSASSVALNLEHGSCEAEVAHQPSAAPLRITTPTALVTVVGTHLRITAVADETMVGVSRGEVALERSRDHARILIEAGEEAVVAVTGAPLKHQSGAAWGRQLTVGPGTAHPTIASLGDLAPGDVVEIAAGTYAEACRFHTSGTVLRPIVLRAAAGPMPWFDGAGITLSGVGAVSRALFQIEGGHYRIEGLGFRNASNQANAAGIRLVESPDVTISGCRIQDCDDGIAGEGDGVVVDSCHISACGTIANDGYCHDCYLEAGSSLEILRSTIDHALAGQDLKCSAHRIVIEGNRIGEAQDGEISILDQPDGAAGDSIRLLGNLVDSAALRRGNHQRFFALASEHGGQRQGSVLVAYNTLVAHDGHNLLLDLNAAPVALVACDNLLLGTSRILEGGGGGIGMGNWAPPGAAVPAVWTHMLTGSEPALINPDGDDWRPRTGGDLAGTALAAGSVPGLPIEAQPRWQPPRSAEDSASARTTWVDPGAWMAGEGAVGPPAGALR